jgi:beta-glucosidase
VELKAGESKIVTFILTEKDLGFYSPEGTWMVEPGLFRVFVGGDSSAKMYLEFKYE